MSFVTILQILFENEYGDSEQREKGVRQNGTIASAEFGLRYVPTLPVEYISARILLR